ncbi:hypothetical protein PsYK624_105790 [Phanerochaete sordida]|uniref:C2H2-type domain-containing protein n=1 Tax=Phanerochaete sordida TaxID=48140 RepID=A0A9P3GIU1_9APHY|nr:hypothetical protein PsYK624_105790 [Phanerochaete sordida]
MARTSQPKRAQKAKCSLRASRKRRNDTPSESESSGDEYEPEAHEDQDYTDGDAHAHGHKQASRSRKAKGNGTAKKNPVSLVNPYDHIPALPKYGRYGGMLRYRAAALWCKINIGRLRTWRHMREPKPVEEALCVACGGNIRMTESELRRHGYAHLQEHLRPFPCPLETCDRRFAQRRQRETHFLIHFKEVPLEDRTYCGIIHKHDGTTCLWWDKDPSRVSTHRLEGHPGEKRPTLEEIRTNERVRIAYKKVSPKKNLAREQDGELWVEPWDGVLADGWGLRGAGDDTGLGAPAPDALALVADDADMQPDPMLEEMLARRAYIAAIGPAAAPAADPASTASLSAASSEPSDSYDDSMDSTPSTSVEPQRPFMLSLPPRSVHTPPILDMSPMYQPPAASPLESNHDSAAPDAVAHDDERPTVPLRRSARTAKSREATTAQAPPASAPSASRSRRSRATRPPPIERAPSPSPSPEPAARALSPEPAARAPTPDAPSPSSAAPVGTFGDTPIGGSFALRLPADWRLRTSRDGAPRAAYAGETWRGAADDAGSRGSWPARMPYRLSHVRGELPAAPPPMASLYDDYVVPPRRSPCHYAPPPQAMFPFGYTYSPFAARTEFPQDGRQNFRLVPARWGPPAEERQRAASPVEARAGRKLRPEEQTGVEALLALREERVHAPAPAAASRTPFDTLRMVAGLELRRLNESL